jgi:hypothetical protein
VHLVLFELHHFVHDELPVPRGNLLVGSGKIGTGNLQVHGGLLFGFVPRMEQPDSGGTVIGAKAFLFAGHVVMQIEAPAVFPFVESESLFHNWIASDEVTTIDRDSGKEPVGVKQGKLGLNPRWHFCWHSKVEVFQVARFQPVKLGGEGRNRATHARLTMSKSPIPLGISIKINYPDLTNFNPLLKVSLKNLLKLLGVKRCRFAWLNLRALRAIHRLVD